MPGLVTAFEQIVGKEIPRSPDEPLASISGFFFGGAVASEVRDLAALLRPMDPRENIQRVLFAGTPPQGRSGEFLMFLCEGKFADRAKIIGEMVDEGVFGSPEPRVI